MSAGTVSPVALRATYRLQLGTDLDFAAVAELVPYLRELGISHLYLSPSLQARSGSTHGYDVVDPTRISDALGGEDGLRRLAGCGLAIILDIVPNHMGVSEQNRWWSDPALREQFFDIDAQTGRHRRFFDIDDLAALRQEDPEVFAVTHAKVLALVGEGVVDGLRVDHPDGLADPAQYLQRLRDGGAERVWVEKILACDPPEQLRDWPVQGTVGYEFLNDLAALFVDPAGEAPLTALWTEISGDTRSFAEVALDAQRELALGTFAPELDRLARLAPQFSARQLAEALARLPVYRTYVQPASGAASEEDRELIARADMDPELAKALTLQGGAGIPDELVTRFQQTSPAVTAKGVEDTAFYRYLRLLALNEVGGDPARFGLSVAAFHAANARRALRFPHALLVTQTHDTKRSGDARARIGALAGLAPQWSERVARWRAMAAPLRRAGQGPDGAEEYLLYQTLVGVWPVERERLDAYLRKALREAKRNSSWVTPDETWEQQVLEFAAALLEHEPFVTDFADFMRLLLPIGERSALGQLLLKLTCPGVPDIFQGDELWRLSLVDPDNRRPVDWDERRRALDRARRPGPPDAADIKLWLILRALALRARRPEAFGGAYHPLAAGGRVCAFLRGDAEVLVVVALDAGAHDRSLSLTLPAAASGEWHSVLDDRSLSTTAGVIDSAGLGDGVHGMWLWERAT